MQLKVTTQGSGFRKPTRAGARVLGILPHERLGPAAIGSVGRALPAASGQAPIRFTQAVLLSLSKHEWLNRPPFDKHVLSLSRRAQGERLSRK